MKTKLTASERDYLHRNKQSSPESRLDWLAAAVEFVHAKKKVVKKHS